MTGTISLLRKHQVVDRIWRKDHTVWRQDPNEIVNRLGWLSVIDLMREECASLEAFSQEVRDSGTEHIVLLGMGGSSLGSEVLGRVFGNAPGYPELITLDSTLPETVQAVAEHVDPLRTLFIVASKSGTTIEPLCHFAYFWALVQSRIGPLRAGRQFVAITDPGTPLARMAEEMHFRQTFLNPPETGGRFSVLSYFGMVPAALSGIDVCSLLDRAHGMRQRCLPSGSQDGNPGLCLGAAMGALARRGRNKLTLVASPAIECFGIWVEQLIAESVGKEGKGIVPVVGEPLGEVDEYGDDRFFVYLQLDDENRSNLEPALEKLRRSGQPLLVISLADKNDLGAEFFRWEFATAIAGAVLGVHPFDQPDVQRAKDLTLRLLAQYQESHQVSHPGSFQSMRDLLIASQEHSYFAVMAYLPQSPAVDESVRDLRRRVVQDTGMATMAGYGPRYLHSTGQLYKGGPGNGVYLHVTVDHPQDVPIPGKAYTFGVLADCQAAGDLQALISLGRPVTAIHLSNKAHESLGTVLGGIRVTRKSNALPTPV